MSARLQKYITAPYIKRLVAVYTAVEVTLLLGIATIWILESVTDSSVALTWGLWRIGDVVPLLVSAAAWILLDNIVSSSKPAIVIFLVMGSVIIVDLISLIWFGIIYRDCNQYIDCTKTDPTPSMCDSVDPLCLVKDFSNISMYYIVLVSVLAFLNLLYAIALGSAMLLLSMKEKGGAIAIAIVSTSLVKQNTVLVRYKYLQLGANFFLLGWLFIVIEVCYLTPYSNIKYYLAFHVLQLVPVILTFVVFENRKATRIGLAVDAISILSSGAGVIVSTLYYVWNCNDPTDLYSDFVNTSTCELTIPGAEYMIAIHGFVVVIAALRVFFYVRTLRNMTQTINSTQQISPETPPEILNNGASVVSKGDAKVKHSRNGIRTRSSMVDGRGNAIDIVLEL